MPNSTICRGTACRLNFGDDSVAGAGKLFGRWSAENGISKSYAIERNWRVNFFDSGVASFIIRWLLSVIIL
jgi:hypothetical protein